MKISIGIDEVGRGPVAGPVVVGAVLVSAAEAPSIVADLVRLLKREPRDSKKETAKRRTLIASYVKERLSFGIGQVSAAEIDRAGIMPSLRAAADSALAQLPLASATEILADFGLKHSHGQKIASQWFVKGDEQHLPILLASHVAKAYRDALMTKLALEHPHYGWERNAGYGTASHLAAIKEHGRTPYHRHSFLKSVG